MDTPFGGMSNSMPGPPRRPGENLVREAPGNGNNRRLSVAGQEGNTSRGGRRNSNANVDRFGNNDSLVGRLSTLMSEMDAIREAITYGRPGNNLMTSSIIESEPSVFTPSPIINNRRPAVINDDVSRDLANQLIAACAQGNLKNCLKLMNNYAKYPFDLNMRDSDGDTAILHLVSHCDENNMEIKQFTDEEMASDVLEVLKLMVENGANVNLVGKDKFSALWFACSENELELVRIMTATEREGFDGEDTFLLLANPNFSVLHAAPNGEARYVTPWHLAIEKANLPMIELLAQAQVNLVAQARFLLDAINKMGPVGGINDTIHMYQRCSEQTSSVGSKAWIRDGSPLHLALKMRRHEPDILRILETLLLERPINQDADEFITLFDPNALDAQGYTALHYTAEKGFCDCMNALFAYGFRGRKVDMNIQEFQHKMTPLMCAILNGQNDIVLEMFRFKVNELDLSLRCSILQMTALHLACAHHVEMDEVVRLLCKTKASVNMKDELGFSPLHLATMHGHITIIKILLNYNANAASVCDDDRESPLHIAAAYGHINIVNTLIREGGAEVHTENRIGRTALHYAFQRHTFLNSRIENCITNAQKEDLETVNPSIAEQVKNYVRVVERKAQREFMRKKKANALTAQSVTTSFPFDTHPYSPVQRMNEELGFDMEQLFLALSNQNMLIKLLLDAGGDLDHEDKNGDPAFLPSARFDWFDAHEEEMTEICEHPNEKGFDSEIFTDKRTQVAVRTRWIASGERTSALQDLFLWLIYVGILTYIATRYSGYGIEEGYGMEHALRDKLTMEEWDDFQSKTLGDVGNTDDWHAYLKIPFFDAIFESGAGYYLPNENRSMSTLETSQFPLMNGMIGMIGRPRYRQKRTLPDSCSEPSRIVQTDDVCFLPGYGGMGTSTESGLDTTPFVCDGAGMSFQVDYDFDSSAFPIVSDLGTYRSGGHTVIIPSNETEAMQLFEALEECSFISMNTRMAVLEMTFYTRSQEIFSHAQIYLEYTSTGSILADSRWSSFQLPSLAGFELAAHIIWVTFCAYYIYLEIRAMTETWGENYIEERKTPMLWWFTIWRQDRAEQYEIDNPKEFRLIFALPKFCCRRTLCIYRTSVPVQPYWVNPFNYMDILMMMVNLSLISVQAALSARTSALSGSWAELSVSDEYVDMVDILYLVKARQYLLATSVFLTYLKSLEFIQVSSSLAIPVIIIGSMFVKISSFFLIFLIFISAFALFDYVLYGFTYFNANTIFKSIVNTFRASLGDIDFDGKYDAGQNFAVIMTCFVAFLMVILLLNLLIAIMNEAFEEIKSSAEARWCYMQFRMIVENARKVEPQGAFRFSIRSIGSRKKTKSKNNSVHPMRAATERILVDEATPEIYSSYPQEVVQKSLKLREFMEAKAQEYPVELEQPPSPISSRSMSMRGGVVSTIKMWKEPKK